MKRLFTFVALLLLVSSSSVVFAQRIISRGTSNQQQATAARISEIWTAVALDQAPSRTLLRIPPASYLVYRLDVAAMKTQLWALSATPENGTAMQLPMPDGTFRAFRVWETSMMPGSLAAEFPDIKTFTAEATNDKQVTAKIDFTLFGFHAVVFDGEKTAMIDPYDNLNDGYYVVHYKKDENRPFSQRMQCDVKANNETAPAGEPMGMFHSILPPTDLRRIMPNSPVKTTEGPAGKALIGGHEAAALTTNGTTIRTYDIAVSANHFYCQAATGIGSPTIGQCFSAITTTMNRVNGVYNRELSVQLNFCVNENLIIWPTATGSTNGADPFAALNTNPAGCIDQNQITCDARIGSSNYDVGHVFTTGAGGLAAVAVICNNSFKAKGVTGSSTPVGDAFDIDYVCHELGHQFGSSHTFNNDGDGACSGNASAANAYEPGSGVTIMDYAGICSPDNVQANSSPYFSANSLEQIQPHIAGSGGACAATSAGHALPTIAGFIATYNIPYKTPFELTSPVAAVSGGDTAVTYSWYQWNLGDFGARLNQTFFNGPIFRSYQPVYSQTRVFPRINNVLAGVLSNSGEKAPDTARYLTFKTVVRGILGGYGCFRIPDDSIHINVSATGAGNGYAGFRVTSQNTGGIIYSGGSTQTITWNRVGTQNPPISANFVDIFMSTDGGFTWPFTVGTFTNTGTASIVVPNPSVASTTCRFKVKGSGNIFFNVNSNNFTVNPGAVTAPIAGTFTVCAGATTTLSNATPTGTWSSSTPAVATVGLLTGGVTGVAAGTATITYTAVSGAVTAVVTVSAVPSPGAITGGTGVCIGLTTALSNATPGGVWSSSDVSRATVNTSGVVTGIAAGTTIISYIVSNTCGSGNATLTMTVSAPTAVAAITGTFSLCQAATTTLANTTPSGSWSSTNTSVATITAGGVVSGIAGGTATISYGVTNAFGCISASSAIVTVNALPVATTTPTGAVVICTGGSILINAAPTTAGLSYQWQDGGVNIAGATTNSFTVSAAGNFRVLITNTSGCTGTSAVVNVTVSGASVVVPSVSFTASPGTNVCSSAGAVNFTAIPINGGGAPAYEWFVNGVLTGGPGATFFYTPANGDVVRCELTSSLPCAVPSTVTSSVTMTVNPTVTPDVSINPTPNDTVCTGQSVTYNAVAIGGGTSPVYQWTVNGVIVATGPSYTTIPANGDIVACQLTSNALCRTATVANSGPLAMTVQIPLANTVTISASSASIAAGESVTFVAIAPNAGSMATYQWFIDGVEVTGATLPTYTTNTLTNGQTVYCKVGSSLPCVLPNIALSGGFKMTVTTGVWEISGGGAAFTLNPNPNNGSFVVMGRIGATQQQDVNISVTNVLGQSVYNRTVTVTNGNLNEQVIMPAGTPAGTYLASVSAGAERVVFRVVIGK
ncbi:MAG: Ig-like domain-containing protein [Taibaiella sp.]|nr:Ig-like domain-containing protein [Taibaiella sp.]